MHDLKLIRDNPEAFDASLARRGFPASAAAVLDLDLKRRDAQTRLQVMQARRNDASREIGQVKSKGGDASALMAEIATLKSDIQAADEADKALAAEMEALLSTIPNLPAPEVPEGGEEANTEIRRWGTPRLAEGAAHYELGEGLGLMDFEAAARMSGARFVVLKGALARLERALGQFMLDLHTTENGYMEVAPPVLVRDQAVYGTGQLPKFAEDLFRTTNGFWLVPTAEVPLTNLVREQILDDADLPLRMTALTPCFRSEAGAAGRDTRGMIRQHQFAKVELVSITTPEQSAAEHERMTACAEEVLKRLDLPYRVLLLAAGDMGFGATKTYDLEVWLPGQKTYREISSCSNCGDFQARRMQARAKAPGAKNARPVHTLNGSGLAVGRTLVAVLENYAQADGSIAVPTVLQPYMGGLQTISPHA
ncbi:serine--tRNA ligase [Zavarzinia aquatilis]|uniref:Serine--tRNA ligase n=1 Tax=Zavarzinia aquatilis TaxID=2211142 RepID=A0A317ECT8_9PROT|nr:serine--tRNA ligase [Zavarzinia aquatilis]PWR24848.1 serine--tRNA ligase [Zavarzinia aquatilis]